MEYQIRILKHKAQGYDERIARIVTLYNQSSKHPNDEPVPHHKKPESGLIITARGDSGGLLLDTTRVLTCGNLDSQFYRIQFAAFDKKNRNKGLLRTCLKYAKDNGIKIGAVEVNGSDELSLWASLGFNITYATTDPVDNIPSSIIACNHHIPGLQACIIK